MNASVRAQLWIGGGEFRLHERPLPEPSPGEVLVRVSTAAICGSDRHTVAGSRESPCPGILGHEGVGVIAALGAGPAPHALDGRPLAPGDRIVWSVVSACGDCDRCLQGHTAKCRHLRKAGHEGIDSTWPLSGSYATHVLLPAGHHVVRLGPELGEATAALSACAGATVMAAFEASGHETLQGARVLVNGIGMLGLLAVIAARAAGAAMVRAVDPDPGRRELARGAGAAEATAPGADPGYSVDSVDLALEFSGAPAGVSAAIAALDVGGTAVLAGSVLPGPAVALDPEALVRGRHRITGVHNYEPRHLTAAVALLASDRAAVLEDPRVLSAPIGLDEVPGAFARPTSHLRTLVAL